MVYKPYQNTARRESYSRMGTLDERHTAAVPGQHCTADFGIRDITLYIYYFIFARSDGRAILGHRLKVEAVLPAEANTRAWSLSLTIPKIFCNWYNKMLYTHAL